MADTLRILPIHAFLGDHQAHESITLAAVHSSSGSKNVWMDEYGNVQPIGGWTKQNQTAVRAGDGPMRLVGIYPYGLYQQIDGVFETEEALLGVFFGSTTVTLPTGLPGSISYMEIRISFDAGITWTVLVPPSDITTPEAPNGTFDILTDSVVQFAQLGDLLVITGPSRTPLAYEGGAPLTLTALNTTHILAAPTVADSGAGLLSGNYKWRVVDVLSDGTRGPVRPATTYTNFINRKALVSWAASISPILQSYEIYRTTGDDTIFFLSGEAAPGTLTFDDNNSDQTILEGRILQEHGDPPPYAALCFVHQQRMFYGRIFDINGDPTFPRKWFFSDPGRPDSVYQDRSFVDCSDGDSIGDFATGGIGDYDGMAVLLNERSIWTLSGTGQYIGAIIDYRLKRSNSRTGAVSGRSAIKVPAGSRWSNQSADVETTEKTLIAYVSNRRDIRVFDGDTDIIISYPVQKTLKRINWNARHRISCVMDDTRQHLTWLLPVDGSSQPNLAVTWNYRHGVWYVWPDWKFACATNVQYRTQPSVILAGEGDLDLGAFCYMLWNGRLKPDGEKPDAQWMSKTIYTPARSGEMETAAENFSTTKRFRWAEWLFWVSGPMNLEVAWLLPEAADDADPVSTRLIFPGSSFLRSSDGSFIRSSDGSFIVVAAVSTGIIRRSQLLNESGHFMHARGLRLRIREAPAA